MPDFEMQYNFDAERNGFTEADDAPHGPQRYQDTTPDLSDPEAFITELSAAEDFFQAEAVAMVRVGKVLKPFKVRSVSHETQQKLLRQLRPKGLRRVWDKKAQQWQYDETSALALEYNIRYAYAKVIMGLADITLRDQTGAIVWQSKGPVQDLPKAITALRAMRLAPGQMDALSDAIDALSKTESDQDQQQQESEEFAGE